MLTPASLEKSIHDQAIVKQDERPAKAEATDSGE